MGWQQAKCWQRKSEHYRNKTAYYSGTQKQWSAEKWIASVILLQIVKWWVLGLTLWKIMGPSIEPMSLSQKNESEIENAWAFA